MSEKYREQAEIISQEQIGTGIFSMWLQTDPDCPCRGAGAVYFRVQPG